MLFQTEPLTEPCLLSSPAALTVTAPARGGAGALHATLVDLWPGSVANRLASGVAMVGRVPERVTVDLGDACCRLEQGRSLR